MFVGTSHPFPPDSEKYCIPKFWAKTPCLLPCFLKAPVVINHSGQILGHTGVAGYINASFNESNYFAGFSGWGHLVKKLALVGYFSRI